MRHRARREPHVLADGHAHRDPGHLEQGRSPRALVEPALFVEDPVVGKDPLDVAAEDLPSMTQGRCVEQATRWGDVHVADHRGTLASAGNNGSERRQVVLYERRAAQQVFRRVPRDRELRKHGEVGSGSLGPSQGVQGPGRVASQVAHDRVDLARRHPDPSHCRSLPVHPGGSRCPIFQLPPDTERALLIRRSQSGNGSETATCNSSGSKGRRAPADAWTGSRWYFPPQQSRRAGTEQ